MGPHPDTHFLEMCPVTGEGARGIEKKQKEGPPRHGKGTTTAGLSLGFLGL